MYSRTKNLFFHKVLTQEYKDRVAVLEAQISGQEIPEGKTSFEDAKQNEGKRFFRFAAIRH